MIIKNYNDINNRYTGIRDRLLMGSDTLQHDELM